MTKKLDHIGIVVKDLNEAVSLYGKILGLTSWKQGVIDDSKNGVRLLSLPIGDTFIELLQPTKPGNRYSRFLAEKGGGLFHLCVFVDNYDQEVRNLKEKGVALEEEMSHANFRLAWVPPESPSGVWVELVDMLAIPKELLHHNF